MSISNSFSKFEFLFNHASNKQIKRNKKRRKIKNKNE
jgi:hypothetical protein